VPSILHITGDFRLPRVTAASRAHQRIIIDNVVNLPNSSMSLPECQHLFHYPRQSVLHGIYSELQWELRGEIDAVRPAMTAVWRGLQPPARQAAEERFLPLLTVRSKSR